MTGAEHYKAAENLLQALEEAALKAKEEGVPGLSFETTAAILLKGLVHATLADAAANALYEPDEGLPEPSRTQWLRAAN